MADTPMSYIHDGRECIGFIYSRGRAGYEAFDAEQRSLGMFKMQLEAADAISAAIAAAAGGRQRHHQQGRAMTRFQRDLVA